MLPAEGFEPSHPSRVVRALAHEAVGRIAIIRSREECVGDGEEGQVLGGEDLAGTRTGDPAVSLCIGCLDVPRRSSPGLGRSQKSCCWFERSRWPRNQGPLPQVPYRERLHADGSSSALSHPTYGTFITTPSGGIANRCFPAPAVVLRFLIRSRPGPSFAAWSPTPKLSGRRWPRK